MAARRGRALREAALFNVARDRWMRRDAAVDEAARDIDIVGIDLGIGEQLCELLARVGEAASFGDEEARVIEVEAFDAFAIDQREAPKLPRKAFLLARLGLQLASPLKSLPPLSRRRSQPQRRRPMRRQKPQRPMRTNRQTKLFDTFG